MNDKDNKLIIESRSNYAFQLKSNTLSFSEIRNISRAFYMSLPEGVRNELYNDMCHGTVKLDSEPELNAYMFAFGAMHYAKLKDAFAHMSANFYNEKEIDIIDYGCGQAIGCISYADYLCENNYTQKVRRITLIEPSDIALARAALHSSLLFPNAEIVTINKGFDDLTASDIEVDSNTPVLHIFSNVLDMGSTANYHGVFNLETLSHLVLEISKGYNEYVLTEPLFGDLRRDEQVDIFTNSLHLKVYYDKKCNAREFVPNKDWTCVIKCGCIGLPDVKTTSLQKDTWTCHEFNDKGTMANKTIINEFTLTEAKAKGRIAFVYYNHDVITESSKEHKTFPAINWYTEGKKRVIFFAKSIADHTATNLKGNLDKYKVQEFDDHSLKLIEITENESRQKVVFVDESNKANNVHVGFSSLHGELSADTIKQNKDRIIICQKIDYKCRKYYELELKYPFAPFSEDTTVIPNNEIWYTSSDGDIVEPRIRADELGANLVANTYKDGRGIIVFDTDIKHLGTVGINAPINGIFHNRLSLTSIILPNSITSIRRRTFRGCSSLSSITIPDSVTSIGGGAFEGCSSLSNVIIPDGVTSIGAWAFRGCSSLKSITIPNSVTSIGDDAFSDCESLKEIYCQPTTPPECNEVLEAFEFNAKGRKIYVPRQSVEAYKSAEGWKEYADDIVGYDFEE